MNTAYFIILDPAFFTQLLCFFYRGYSCCLVVAIIENNCYYIFFPIAARFMRDLSDSQKVKFWSKLNLLQQQLAETRLCSSVAETYKLWVKEALIKKIIFTQDFHFFNHSVCGFSTG